MSDTLITEVIAMMTGALIGLLVAVLFSGGWS
jgi:hypothetical protein